MGFWKDITTNWQYEHNIRVTKLITELVKQNKELTERVWVLEKFALESGKYFELIEERRKSDLKEKGK